MLVVALLLWSGFSGTVSGARAAGPSPAPAPGSEEQGTVTAAGNGGFTAQTPSGTYNVGPDLHFGSYPHSGSSTAPQVGDHVQLRLKNGKVVAATVLPPYFDQPAGPSVAGVVSAVSSTIMVVNGTAIALLPQTAVINLKGLPAPASVITAGDQVNVTTYTSGGVLYAGRVWLVRGAALRPSRPQAEVFPAPGSEEPPVSTVMSSGTSVSGGSLTANTTWAAAGSPYTVQGTLNTAGYTLTIKPGVTVKFAPGATIVVSGGSLTAVGGANAMSRIVFQSAAAAPTAFDWPGLRIAAPSIVTLDEVTIAGSVCGIDAGSASPTVLKLTNFSIAAGAGAAQSQAGGICSDGTPDLSSGVIQNGAITVTGEGSTPLAGISGGVLPAIADVDITLTHAGGYNAGISGIAVGNVSNSTVTYSDVPPAGAFTTGIMSAGDVGALANNAFTFNFNEPDSGGSYDVGVLAAGNVGQSTGNSFSFRGSPTGGGESSSNLGIQAGASVAGTSGDSFRFTRLNNSITNTGIAAATIAGGVTGDTITFATLTGNPTNTGIQTSNSSVATGAIARTAITFNQVGAADGSSYSTNNGIQIGGSVGDIAQNSIRFRGIAGNSNNHGLWTGDTGLVCLNLITFQDLNGFSGSAYSTAAQLGNVNAAGAPGCGGAGQPGLSKVGDDHNGDDHSSDSHRDDSHRNGDQRILNFYDMGSVDSRDGAGDDDARDDTGSEDDSDDDDGGAANRGGAGCATAAGLRSNTVVFSGTASAGNGVGNTGFQTGDVYGGITNVVIQFANGAADVADSFSVNDTAVETGNIWGPFACNQIAFTTTTTGSTLSGLMSSGAVGLQYNPGNPSSPIAVSADGVSNNRITARTSNVVPSGVSGYSGAPSAMQAISSALGGLSGSPLAVQGNVIVTDTSYVSFGLDRIGDDVAFTNNTLTGPGGLSAVPPYNGEALHVQSQTGITAGTTIACNNITGWATGIQVGTALDQYGNPLTPALTSTGAAISSNNLSGNLAAIANTDPRNAQAATGNYYGGTPSFHGAVASSGDLPAAPACAGGTPNSGGTDGSGGCPQDDGKDRIRDSSTSGGSGGDPPHHPDGHHR